MTNEIRIEVRNVYGVVKYYPMCDRAKLFAGVAGTVTLTPTSVGENKKFRRDDQIETTNH